MTKNKKPEILAPTSTLQSVIAALNAGCDAIYIGGSLYSARAYAQNPENESLESIIKECRQRGVKVFVTVNTLYKDSELQGVLDFISKIYSYGVYGLIIQDLGLFSLVKGKFPHLKLSCSTQMTVHSSLGVKKMSAIGFDRVVLARELSFREIKTIKEENPHTEIEIFAQGALCVSYSGRCLLSSAIGGRSGNRGRCAQPCRMVYTLYKNNEPLKKGYLLSPRDISTLPDMKDILHLGIDSLKIEGRMKSPEYVYQTVSLYSKYLSSAYEGKPETPSKEDINALLSVFNRGGKNTEGYLKNFAGLDMMSGYPKNTGLEVGRTLSGGKKVTIEFFEDMKAGDGIEIWSNNHTGTNINLNVKRAEKALIALKEPVKKGSKVFRTFDKALNDNLKKNYQNITRQLDVNVKAILKTGEKAVLRLPQYNMVLEGDIVTEALSSPLSKEDVTQRLSKSGNSPFKFHVDIEYMEENVYLPVSSLNNIKRDAIELLSQKLTEKRPDITLSHSIKKREYPKNKKIYVRCASKEQTEAALELNVDRIYTFVYDRDMYKKAKERGIEYYIALPQITRGNEENFFSLECDGFLLSSHTEVPEGINVALDQSFNIFNGACYDFLDETYKPTSLTLSTELSLKERENIGGEKAESIIYGRVPLMTTHQCPIGLYEGQKQRGKYCSRKGSKGKYELLSLTQNKYPVVRNCEECFAMILSDKPLYMLNNAEKLKKISIFGLNFTTENKKETFDIIKEHIAVLKEGKMPSHTPGEYDSGHFFKEVL
ncbi:MAG: U32 family peptidase [Firmicutes bacterium]|nr:U32 family peptidase [Bacillota bacterium]